LSNIHILDKEKKILMICPEIQKEGPFFPAETLTGLDRPTCFSSKFSDYN
jgi:hypothetical protein